MTPFALLATSALCAAALLAARRCDARRVRHGGAGVRTAIGGLVAVALVALAVGCSRPDPPAAAPVTPSTVAPAGAPTEPPQAVLEWGDGLDHVVVYADDRLIEAIPSGYAGASRVRRHVLGSAAQSTLPADDQTTEVHRLDGAVEWVLVPGESLVAVAAATADESELVRGALAGGAPIAMIVVDRTGVAGTAGQRYLLTHGRLDAIGPAVAPSTIGTGGPDDAPAVTTGAEDRRSVGVDHLTEVAGVVSVVQVAPGVAAVATAGSREDLARVAGVHGVADDPLLDYAADPTPEPRQAEQWMLANDGGSAQAGGWLGVARADTRAPRAWPVTEGSGVIVAVVDSGVDLASVEMYGRLWVNAAETCGNGIDDDRDGRVDDCRGWDFGTGDANPGPDPDVPSSGHGTHVAGVIAASRNGIGVVGMAPAATIMPLKVSNAAGSISTSAVYAAVVYAVDHGAAIVNLSLATRPGTARSSVSALENAVTYARARGVLVVTGTGNDGIDISSRTKAVWPASFSTLFDNVMSVGASTNSDERAAFSNFGDPTTVYAPGWWLLSTLPDGAFGFMSGTSQAAAVGSGAAALVMASGVARQPRDVRQRIVDTAAITATGYRIDAASAVGVPPDPVVSVTYEGIERLEPDTTGTVAVRFQATNVPAPVAKVRLSLAAAVDLAIYAVEGVSGVLGEEGGALARATTDASGAFPAIAVVDPAALAGSGWVLSSTLALPRGDYALVTELLDGDDRPLGGAQVAYVSIGGGLPVTSTTTASPTSTPGSISASTTTIRPGTATTTPRTTIVPPSTAPRTTTTRPVTSMPSSSTTAAGAATTVPSASTPRSTTSSIPSGSVPATTRPSTTVAATTSTTRPSTTTIAASTTTRPSTIPRSTTSTTVAAPPSTTPPPVGSSQGAYRITSVNPRYATLSGGTPITITGVFPTSPVYVWFGDKGIVEATSADGTTLQLLTPAVQSAGVTDIDVKFTLDTAYDLRLARAFTFGTAPAPTTTAAGPPTTRPATSTTARPATTSTVRPTTSAVPTTAPGTTVPRSTTSSPRATTTTSAGPTTTTSPTAGQRLRPQPATGAISSLALGAWPRPGCSSARCEASSL